MRTCFEKPVGSHADVKELEYISALHQTSVEIRRNASIQADDIIYMLLSRFGIEVQHAEVVKKDILTELAGDPQADPRNLMDLRQTAALLLLPHLKKCQAEGDPNNHIAAICQEIRREVSGSNENQPKSDTKILVTSSFVKGLLAAHCNELDVSEDLVEQMVEVAGGEGVEFDEKNLLRALTQDLDGYNLDWETRWSTSYTDVLGATPPIPMGRRGSVLRSSVALLGQNPDRKARQPKAQKSAQDVEDPLPQTEKDSNFTFADTDEEPEMTAHMAEAVVRVPSLSAIDGTADSYGSQAFAVLMLVAVICVFLAYMWGGNTGQVDINCDESSNTFACQIGHAIVTWLSIFAQLILLGATFVLFGSMGNTVYLPHGMLSVLHLLLAMGVVFMFTLFPIIYPKYIENWFFNTKQWNEWVDSELFQAAAAGVGLLLLLLQILGIARLTVPFEMLYTNLTARRLLSQGAAKKECQTKRAAAFKTNRMVENAMHLRQDQKKLKASSNDNEGREKANVSASSRQSTSSNRQVMSNFHATSYLKERSPGLLWAWKAYWSGSVCYEEGVWVHTRLIASALIQVFVLGVTIILMINTFDEINIVYATARGETQVCSILGYCATYYGNNETADSVNKLRDSVKESLVETVGNITEEEKELFYQDLEGIIHAQSGINITSEQLLDFTEDPYGAVMDWLVDHAKEEDVKFGAAIGTVFSLLSTLWILFGYIPSYIFNVMKFRCGAYPTLYETDFQMLRQAPDHSTLAFGMAFWSTLFMAFFSFFGPGIMAFFLIWEETRPYLWGAVAQVIGIVTTILIKVIFLGLVRQALIAGFYRKELAFSNLLFMLLECWNIALSAGFLIGRTVIFVLLSIFYIGRIDTPFMAHEVDKFDFSPNLALDRAPVIYRKDLLLHEAHRHPYLDRLAALYLLKLNLGDSFATRASSVWRLIYAMTLMPWLRKYRVNSIANDDNDGANVQTDGSIGGEDAAVAAKASLRESILVDEVTRLRKETEKLKEEMRRAKKEEPVRSQQRVILTAHESRSVVVSSESNHMLPDDDIGYL